MPSPSAPSPDPAADPASRAARARRFPGASSLALAAALPVLLILFMAGYAGVASDGRDYFAQARSLIVDHDLRITDAELVALGAPGLAPLYPVGTALLWSPFLAATHVSLGVLNLLGGDHLRDGYGRPYQIAAGLATVLYGFAALVMIASVLRQYFPPGLAALATLVTCAGSFLLWYLVVEASMSHGASLFATTLFLWHWHRTRAGRTTAQWIGLGAAAGLMTIVRWQNALFVLVAALDAVPGIWPAFAARDARAARGAVRGPAAATVAAGAALVPQLLLWGANGHAIGGLPAGEFHVSWLEPFVANVLFSPLHGLVSTTPLLYVALLGLLPFVRRTPRVGALLVVALLGQLYANSIIEGWWGGSAFGGRRFAACTLIFAVGLAAAIDWARRHPLAAAAVVLAPFVVVNLLLMRDTRAGRVSLGTGWTAADLLAPVHHTLGNPFSFPANLAFALEHGVSPAVYDALGTRLYNDLRIDVGEPGDEPFLTYGWSMRERQPALSFRWAVGHAAGVAVPIGRRDDYLMRVAVEPFHPLEDDPPFVVVVVNGREVARLALGQGLRNYVVAIPIAAMRPNLNHVRFQFSHAVSPRELGQSEDARPLAVLFDAVSFERRR